MRPSRPVLRRVAGFTAAALALGLVPFVAGAQNASAAPTELFFSEYIEGSGNNKALEIYNGTAAPVDLATGGYNVQMFFNGSSSALVTVNLTGTVAAGDALPGGFPKPFLAGARLPSLARGQTRFCQMDGSRRS